MKQAIILHGTLGSPEGNWFRWLEAKLVGQGLNVWVPDLPDSKQPSLAHWAAFVHANCPLPIDQDTLIIGHSSGAILALILAQQSDSSVGAVVGVSVFHDNSLGWAPNNQLFDVPFDFKAVQRNTHTLLFIHSDNDPYVPLEQARYVANKCNGELVIIPHQGHFNIEQSPDYREFPALLDILRAHNLL